MYRKAMKNIVCRFFPKFQRSIGRVYLCYCYSKNFEKSPQERNYDFCWKNYDLESKLFVFASPVVPLEVTQHIHLEKHQSGGYLILIDRDLLYLSNATGFIQWSPHIIANELLKVKVHGKFARIRIYGILVITFSDAVIFTEL